MKKHIAKKNKTTNRQISLPFVRINELPDNITQIILMRLPLRDMARTSILSKHWRYQWVKVPQLVFMDDPKYSANKVLKILLLHHGPILKFTLDVTAWQNCSEIDSIIPFLSRNGIKELALLMPDKDESYELPSSIFSCVELQHLSLSRCVFQPHTIARFGKLVSLELSEVELDSDVSISSCPFLESLVLLNILTTVNLFSIDAPRLNKLHFKDNTITCFGIMNTPLLKHFCLFGNDDCYTGNSSHELICFLRSLPFLEELRLCYNFLQMLDVADNPNKLQKLSELDNLRILELSSVTLTDLGDLSSLLWFIRSSPNLQTLKFNIRESLESPTEAEAYLKIQDPSHYSLLKLQNVEVILPLDSRDFRVVVEFAKFLLGISPVLGTLYMKPNLAWIDANGYKMLVELACYPRASPKAKIVFADLESLDLTLL